MEKPSHILLVEDEFIIAISQKIELEELGYRITVCNNGEQAVQLIRENIHFEYVLMDMNLGKGINGAEAAKQILLIKDIPISFLSSCTEDEIAEKAKNISNYGFIQKPSLMPIIDSHIKNMFKLHKETKKKVENK